MSKSVQLDGQTRSAVNTGAKTVGTSVVQVGTNTRPLKWGVQVVADAANTAGVWVGVRSNLTAGTADGTSGFKLEPGASILVPAPTETDVYAVSTSTDQTVTFLSF